MSNRIDTDKVVVVFTKIKLATRKNSDRFKPLPLPSPHPKKKNILLISTYERDYVRLCEFGIWWKKKKRKTYAKQYVSILFCMRITFSTRVFFCCSFITFLLFYSLIFEFFWFFVFLFFHNTQAMIVQLWMVAFTIELLSVVELTTQFIDSIPRGSMPKTLPEVKLIKYDVPYNVTVNTSRTE